jgi:hypothetical protein
MPCASHTDAASLLGGATTTRWLQYRDRIARDRGLRTAAYRIIVLRRLLYPSFPLVVMNGTNVRRCP